MNLQMRARYAALRRHKRRQQSGLWCEPGCAFHNAVKLTAERVWDKSTGVWTWMYCNNVDQIVKEGLWD
ncbi:hypothetical protein GCM10022252_20110 [Streptosporangium oxazolinicum]|uniref:Uncharacterized protein n=1 Tax=Streptosporangium oxazolinicum TaxID=909287 RepID=A0ABP8APF2_9ACTN